MEGTAYLERHGPLGPQLLGNEGCLFHCGPVAADDHLAGTVVVGDDHRAQGGGPLAGILEGRAVQAQDRDHGALSTACRPLHGLAPEGHQPDGGSGIKDSGGVEGGVFSQ